MFALSKLGLFLVTPSTALVLLTLAGTVLAFGRGRTARLGRIVALGSALALLVFGLGPEAGWIVRPLENRFPPEPEPDRLAGIVVLGGAVHPNTSASRGQIVFGDSGERLLALADLARRHPGTRVVFSGGSGALSGEEVPEADIVERFAASLGLPPGRVTYERRSRTTWENARETRALLGGSAAGPWLLVTSAWHMPRAMGAFRQAGFDVRPYPVDYRTAPDGLPLPSSATVASGLDLLDTGVKEWLGLLVYRLAGRSAALWPAPQPAPPSSAAPGTNAMR